MAQLKSMTVSVNINQPFIEDVKQQERINAPINPASGYTVSYTNTGKLKETYDEKPGIGLQAKILYSVSPKVFISTGVDLSFIRYKRSIEVDDLYDTRITSGVFTPQRNADGNLIFDGTGQIIRLTPPSGIFGPTDKTGKTSVLNVGIPVLAGTSFLKNKLMISVGGIFSMPITASTYEHQLMIEYNGELTGNGNDFPLNFIGREQYSFRQQDTKKNVTKQFNPSAGLMTQIGFRLWKKFQADLTLQKNLTRIYKSEYPSAGKAKLNLLSLGISYTFVNFNSPE